MARHPTTAEVRLARHKAHLATLTWKRFKKVAWSGGWLVGVDHKVVDDMVHVSIPFGHQWLGLGIPVQTPAATIRTIIRARVNMAKAQQSRQA